MKNLFSLYFLLLSACFYGQQNQPWRSFFSYNDVVDVSQSDTKVFSAASSAMFEKNTATGELKTITSVDGLKVETITAIMHSTAYKRTLVGNSNGLLNVINSDGSIINKIDIIQENTVTPSKKKINHIYEYDGKAYIATDFGIAVFNLATLEFGDTYYLGPNGSEVAVLQSTIFSGYIFAASLEGIRFAQLSNPNLNDFSQWSEYTGGSYTGVLSFGGNLFGANTTGMLVKLDNGEAIPFATFPSPITDLREANGYMVVTCANRVNAYNEQLIQEAQINVITLPEAENAVFSCATVVGGKVYIGTVANGMFSAGFSNFVFNNITPNGPQRSNIVTIKKAPSALWAVYGDFTATYNPYSPYLDYLGVSKFTDVGWTTIPNNEVFTTACIADIAISPTNENLVYVSSYFNGLIKIENDVPTILYNDQNTNNNLQKALSDRSIRIHSLAFDKSGSLWMTNVGIDKPLKQFKVNGNSVAWSSYTVEGLITDLSRNYYGKMAIDKNGTKWIPTTQYGVLAYNESINNKRIIITEGDNGNLPSFEAKCVAIDNNNRLWIGTTKGLRVLAGVDRFMNQDQLTTNPIIIMEDGLAQELMYEQPITDITVDGANNKWLATGGAGVFLVSPDGQETLFHFTKENSPLPSNVINDVEIDHVTGEVFFATDIGMVSFRGTSTEASDDLSKVYVFPNPVRPDFDGDVNISALTDNAVVKITDIEGNLVYETTSEGGTVLWDTRAFGKYKVASGVYMIFISSEDGTQTKVKKVMIIR
ncbi:type IX secretion system anionic LPS delivery protein PorZ [Flavobacterium suzhouense]|uniref:T9SS type A sorting domain-containing protein n=1 Tax=Flavobacterium suzhouense TaxID=1529638 RepID=A0ABW5NQ34_9FLAO